MYVTTGARAAAQGVGRPFGVQTEGGGQHHRHKVVAWMLVVQLSGSLAHVTLVQHE
jgi:hypothetical protein